MKGLLRFLSRIRIRLLAFNVLLVFLPAFGVLSLQVYEQQLLAVQERALVQEARLLAATLGERGTLKPEAATRIFQNLRGRPTVRLRVVDVGMNVVSDSGPTSYEEDQAPDETDPEVRRSVLYRLGRLLYRGYEALFLPSPPRAPSPEEALADFPQRLAGHEVAEALGGMSSRATRATPDERSVTLTAAEPVKSDGVVVGAVVVSKSTYPILRSLYDLRLATFKVVLASVAAAVVLSLFASWTIDRPLVRLRDEALAILDRRGRLKRTLKGFRRLDEIGDLSRALAELTRRLEAHIRFIESFASDVSHEFKNPLAAIRNATELLADVEDPEDRERFLRLAQQDVARLEHLLEGVRDITRIDAQLEAGTMVPVDVRALLAGVLESRELRDGERVRFRFVHPETPLVVTGSPERLEQVFENLIDNAVTFSPPGGEVRLELEARGSELEARIVDAGPGIPEEHLERIFQRFFSYRPQLSAKGTHTGLGLAIVRAIVDGYGGSVAARNAPGGGAVLTVRLPLARGG